MKNKRGENILLENVVFIVIIVLFISVLVFFILRQGQGAVIIEDIYSKKIALMIDAAKPGMEIELNAKSLFDVAEKNGMNKNNVVSIDGNNVVVKASEKGRKDYGFFNDVSVDVSVDGNKLVMVVR